MLVPRDDPHMMNGDNEVDISSVPFACLQQMFSMLPLVDKVCRTWHNLLACPSAAWHTVQLPTPPRLVFFTTAHHATNTTNVAWFTTRANSIHTFTDTRLYAKPSIVHALLTHNIQSLHVLDVVALQPAPTWRLLVRCVNLRVLRVHFIGPWHPLAETSPRLDGLQQLTNLESLELGGAELIAPCDIDLGALHRLTSLQLNMPVAHGDVLGGVVLPSLRAVSFPELYCGMGLPQGLPPGLTSLKLDAWRPTEHVGPADDVVTLLTRPPAVHAPAIQDDLAALVRQLPELQVLHVGAYPGNPDLTCIASALQPPHVRLPTAITSLALRRCSLTELPAAIQHLPYLAFLDLRYNQLRCLPCWTAALQHLRRVRLERQRGPAFSQTLPLSVASRPGLVIQISPTVEALPHQHSTRLRLVVRLVSSSGETLCHLSLLNSSSTWSHARGGTAHRPRLATIGGSIKATQRMAASRGWRACLRPGGAVEDVHVEGGRCGCMACTRRACCAAMRNLVLVHDDIA